MIYYVIPARKGSKGLPYKNRMLFDYTAISVKSVADDVIVTTDDEVLIEKAKGCGFKSRVRPDEFAQDTTSIKTVLHDLMNYYEMKQDDVIVLLYVTYPERTWKHICDGLQFYYNYKAKSMLCRKEWQYVHPCLCLWDMGNNKGKQLFYHNYFRRQDYPQVFQISHFLAIFEVSEFIKLNNQLYNDATVYMPIDNYVDIDTIEDVEKLKVENENVVGC